MSGETKQTAEATTEQLCRLFDLTAARIGQLRKDGIIYKTSRNTFDLWKSVKGYITFLQKNKIDGAQNIQRSETVGDAHELEELVRQVKAARTYNDARTLKVQIDALRSGYALEVEQNRYCSKSVIKEAFLRIILANKAMMMRLIADLPPMIEGTSPAQCQKIIKQKVYEILDHLQNSEDKIYSSDAAHEKDDGV
jgi:hypothetical protein